MKIIHILNSLKGGGIQNFILSLAPEQKKLGCDVSIIVVDRDTYEYSKHLKDILVNNGVKVYYLNKILHNKISFIKTLINCRKLVQSLRPDIINSHGEMSHIYGAFSTIGRKKINHYITIHNGPENWSNINKILNRNKPLIFCSQAAFDLKEQNNKKYCVIDNGVSPSIVKTKEVVDLRKELKLRPTCKIIVLVGSLRPQKNYDFLTGIVQELKDDTIHFCICGGNYGKGYIDIENFKQYKTIHFLGLRSDVSAIENSANLFLSCSTFEGLPIAVLEAYFNGIPCVLSPIEQHIKISNVPKCWIPKTFTAHSFIATIKEALKDQTSHDNIYQERLPIISKYSISESARKYINFYKQKYNETQY